LEFYQSSLNGEDELQHWGIKGMRWGRRRYQNKDGSLTPAGRKRYGQDDLSPEERAEREAATKKAVMNSGDARKVLAYQSNLTNEELRKALDRVDLNSRLSKINADATKSGFDKAMSAIDTVDKVRSAGEKLVNTWNLIAGISNSLNKTSKLPQIDKGAKAFAESYIDQLKKNGSAEQIMEQIKLGNVKTSDLNDFANIMRNRETINSYTAAAQAAKQKEEKAKAAEEAAKKAREAAKSNAEVKAAEAKAAQAAANARKAEAEAAAAEAKLKDKLNNNGK